jgi:hypothetical protein
MNSTLMKIVIAYIAGIGTYALFQNHNISKKLDMMSGTVIKSDSDTSASPNVKAMALLAPAGTSCPCDNEARYNVTHALESQNVAITKVPDCLAMVHGANPGPGTIVGAGAWFSKITLDNMFCNKSDANGIFVYKGYNSTTRQWTFIVEAARTEYISSLDDGTSYIYYSRTMCPNICGQCASDF